MIRCGDDVCCASGFGISFCYGYDAAAECGQPHTGSIPRH